MNTKIRYPLGYLITIITLLGCPVVSLADFTDVEDRSLSADGITSLDAKVIKGDIQVTAHADNQVTLKIHRTVKGVDEEEAAKAIAALKTVFEADGKVVRLEEDHPKNSGEWKEQTGLKNMDYDLRYELWLPAKLALKLRSIEGDLQVAGISGECKLNTVHGDILVVDAGSIQANSVEGDVIIKTAAGFAHASTVQGDISISDTQDFGANSVEGDIHIEANTQPQENCQLNTVGGDVLIQLAPELAVSIQAQSLSGKVNVSLPLDKKVSTGGQIVGSLNGGGTKVQVNSIGGDITIK